MNVEPVQVIFIVHCEIIVRVSFVLSLAISRPEFHLMMWLLYGMENSIPAQISNFLTHQPKEPSDNMALHSSGNAYKAIPLSFT